MSEPFVSIIMRSHNEGWALRETLPALRAQNYKNWELIVIDSGSTDGSVELLRNANPARFIQIKPQDYNPARVMNRGMQLARSEFGIFLNADATPQGNDWLRPLVLALQDPQVAAVFGKQIPRPDCRAVFAHDYERCFGPNRESARWEHFFSMASSGIRKDIWAKRGFLEKMQYSEDDEYTRWCRAQGCRIVYVPESVAMHSHNYTPGQARKRSFGEARALAAVWTSAPDEFNFFKTVLIGWANDARRDFMFCARQNRLHEWPHAIRIRWQQRRARLAGFREGWNFYRHGRRGHIPAKRREFEFQQPAALCRDAATNPPPRFTLDGSENLENHLAGVCKKVLAGVQSLVPEKKLDALVLGGGYGRGEGGVLRTESGDLPYNDLEFYIFLSGNRIWNERKFAGPLHELGGRLPPHAGLHVEFKVDSLDRMQKSPVTMFTYDLVSRHKVIFGREDIFSRCGNHLDGDEIPLSEATRLLFNRCTGLLLAKEFLRGGKLTPDQADFVGRNLAKAELALGDAVLAALGKYHWSCVERRERLSRLADSEEMPWLAGVKHHHATGVDFKLHPRRMSKPQEAFHAEHRQISELASQVWLWLENRRLDQRFFSAHDYAFSPVQKFSGAPAWRNFLLNLKTFGLSIIGGGMATRYPRERLFNSLPLLLWDEPANDLKAQRHLQIQLRTRASDWQGLVAAYKTVWPKFS